MAEIVNLKQRRKQKARAEAGRAAAENRARFGRTPAQRARDEAETAEAAARMARLHREPSLTGSDGKTD